MNEYCDSGQCPAQARVTVFTRQRPAVHVRAPFPPALRRARAARVRRVRHADRRSDPLPRAGLASLSMCEYPHVVVTGASSSTGRAVTLCLAATRVSRLRRRPHPRQRRRAAPAHAARRRPDHPAAARRQPPDPGHGRRAGRHRAHRPGRPRRAGERHGHGRLRPAARGQRHRRARRHPGVRAAAAPGPGPDRAHRAAGARSTPPFAGPLAATSATLRGELAPWHIDVTLTEPGAAAGAVTRALTAPRPRATSASPWFGLYDLDAASPGPLRADGRARASARSVHKRCFLCYFLAHAR